MEAKYSFKNADQFKRKPEIEANGTWFEFADGREIKISAATDHNPVWRAVSEKFWQEYRRLVNAKAAPDRVRALQSRYFAQYLLKDWSGFLSEDDVEIPFSKEAAEAMLLDLDDIFEQVAELVFGHKNFRTERAKVVIEEGKGS